MAKGALHAIVGTGIGIIAGIAIYLTLGIVIWYIPFLALFYSLLPDIDHKSSYITWFFIFIAWMLIGLTIFFGLDYLIPGFIILTIVNVSNFKIGKFSLIHHRGPTHTLQFVILAPLLLLLIPSLPYTSYLICIAFGAGWSHLICDKIPFKISLKGEI